MLRVLNRVLIIGLGEIGSAIREIELDAKNEVSYIDLDCAEGRKDNTYDICHVCIPYKSEDQFIGDIKSHFDNIDASVVIVHSTVEVGITRKLHKAIERPCVHSFVRGVHPNLKEGLLTFEKPVGSVDTSGGITAKEHLVSLGIKVKELSSPEASELGKLLDTTYYGYNILFAKHVNEMCNEYNLDYDEVYTWANETYNDGYKELNKCNVVRPVLTPPENGKIGGHCVVPNFKLLPTGKLKDWCLYEMNYP